MLVTEGYMDVVALAQLGFPNAVATLGTACTAEHVHKLLRFTEKVIFSFDGDAAGRRAAGRALEAALPHATDTRSFRFLFLPKEHDPDSYVREHGAKAFEQYVQGALPLSQQLIEMAQNDCDMTTAEGRARMLAQARPLWSALPEGALQKQLLSELAVKGNLPLADLQSLWRTGGPRPRRPERTRRGRGRRRALARRSPATSTMPTPRSPAGVLPPSRRRARARPGRDFPGAKPGGFRSNRPMNPKWAAIARQEAEIEAQRRQPRKAPPTAETRAIQMLFGHPEYWDQLSADEHELLHALPAPYGPLVAWLERDHAEHGPRPWAVLSHALRDDSSLDATALAIANGDAEPNATYDDFRQNVDRILDRELKARTQALIAQATSDPDALQRYREVYKHWEEVKARLSAQRPAE